MSIKFPCPKCGKLFSVADHLTGKNARCNACGSRFIVPAGPAFGELKDEGFGEGLPNDPLGEPPGDMAMPPTPAFPIPVTYATPTMPPSARPSAQPTARSDDDDSEDNAANRRSLVMSLVLSGIFLVIMIVIVGQGARKLFAATPFEVPPQYFAIPGFILLFLPVPYALYHLFRIMHQRRLDFAGSSFVERLSFAYRFYFFYVGRIHPEYRGSQNVMYVMTAYVVFVTAGFIYFMDFMK